MNNSCYYGEQPSGTPTSSSRSSSTHQFLSTFSFFLFLLFPFLVSPPPTPPPLSLSLSLFSLSPILSLPQSERRKDGEEEAGREKRGWKAVPEVDAAKKAVPRARVIKGVANAILIKPNQIGTLTETLAAISMAEKAELRLDRLASLGRDRGHHHRRHRGGNRRNADQDRLDVALGSHRQIQSAAAHRGDARRRAALCGARCVCVGGTLASP